MRSITAEAFEAECLDLLDNLEPDGLVITKEGKPVARVVPYVQNSTLIGILKDKITIRGDLMSTGLFGRP